MSHYQSPLLSLHHSVDAEMQNYDAIEIVSTFGEPQAEYAAVRKSAGMMDAAHRGILEITGADRLAFLNNLLSNETWNKERKENLPAGKTVYAFFLNGKGRIVADMNVIELGDRTLLEMDVRWVESIRECFEKYLFVEKVKMRSMVGELHEISILGPGAVGIVREAMELPQSFGALKTCATATLLGQAVVAWTDDSTGSIGVNLVVPSQAAGMIWANLLTLFGPRSTAPDVGEEFHVRSRLRPIGWAVLNSVRIEAGRPLVGIDIGTVPVATAFPAKKQREESEVDETTPGVLPAETGLFDRAISLSKCYLGQEIVARMHARNQFARKIVGLKILDDALPLAGSPVFDDKQNAVGAITSSTVSPVLSNACIALAFVKKNFAAEGTELIVPAEGAMRKAKVVTLPFVPATTS